MYTKEIAQLCGEAYYEILKILNGAKGDVYSDASYRFPFRCLMLLYPRAIKIGATKTLDEKMGELMNLISPDDIKDLMEKPIQQSMILYYEIGRNKHLEKRKANERD